MTLSLVINTYNQPDALSKVLRNAFEQSVPPSEILIADDGSTEETRALIVRSQASAPCLMRHLWQEKSGFRRSRILNRCIAAATGDYLVFLDGDSVPHRHFVRDHLALAEPGFWVQGRRAFVKEKYVAGFEPDFIGVLSYALLGRLSGLGKAVRLPFPLVKKSTRMNSILGCNLGIWRKDLLAVNGYDESFEGWGKEDSDLGARLYHLGRPQKLVHGRAIIFHLNHSVFPRNGLKDNEARLAETLRSKTIRCRRGIIQDGESAI